MFKSISQKGRLILGVSILIILALFNVILFVATKDYDKGTTFWVSYLFITLSMLCVSGSILLTTARDRDGVIMALPIIYVSFVYLLLELIAGFATMFLGKDAALWSGIIQGALFGVYIVIVLLAMLGLLFIKGNRDAVAAKVGYIDSLRNEIDALRAAETDPEVKKALNELYDDVRYSDPMSDPSLESIEAKIQYEIQQLETLKDPREKKGKIEEIRLTIKKRNNQVKTRK